MHTSAFACVLSQRYSNQPPSAPHAYYIKIPSYVAATSKALQNDFHIKKWRPGLPVFSIRIFLYTYIGISINSVYQANIQLNFPLKYNFFCVSTIRYCLTTILMYPSYMNKEKDSNLYSAFEISLCSYTNFCSLRTFCSKQIKTFCLYSNI